MQNSALLVGHGDRDTFTLFIYFILVLKRSNSGVPLKSIRSNNIIMTIFQFVESYS